jgi:hypothetical protein
MLLMPDAPLPAQSRPDPAAALEAIISTISVQNVPAFAHDAIELLGESIDRLADLEDKHKVYMSTLSKASDPHILAAMVQGMDPEPAGRLFKLVISLAPLAADLNGLAQATPDEKRALAQRLKDLANSIGGLSP